MGSYLDAYLRVEISEVACCLHIVDMSPKIVAVLN